jgi:immune inhibitor A
MRARGIHLAAALSATLLLAGGRADAVRPEGGTVAPARPGVTVKPLDEPNPADRERVARRRRLLARAQRAGADGGLQVRALELEAQALATVGSDRILVILVEFAGTDTFTWTKGSSTWDPLGRTSSAEVVRDGSGNPVAGDCSLIINDTRSFTYSGPLHNRIERPRSAADRSGSSIWTPDFSPAFFNDLILGDGVVFDYTRQDGSAMYRSFLGRSVRDYYEDMSGGRYTLTGAVVGWVQVPHSVWWYGADQCPGARSAGTTSVWTSGAIPGAGSAKTLVVDALEAVKAAYPAFDWASFDVDRDGVIDRLWVIHAGYGEEDSAELLDRTDYGEAQIWSHSSSLAPAYEIVPGVRAGAYIVMPENSGMGVLAHEFGHNIGADDLYAYNGGDTSAGFWTIMADDWTGYPIGFQPPAFDPWHLDGWGWLDPKVIADPTRTYTVAVGQASGFPGGADVYRGVKIVLPDQQMPLAVAPRGNGQWWGGAENLVTSTMTLRSPIQIPAAGATLSFALAYRTEELWDWLWVQASDDGGATWRTLTNAHTRCDHHPQWIGGQYGLPEDLCAAGIGGFTGASPGFPAYATETFSLAAFADASILLRFWYMTDWGTLDAGVFVDDVVVSGMYSPLLSDNAETDKSLWTYGGAWERVGSGRPVPHAYYLQWRNVGAAGGYDSALGDPLWRYGPANTGLLVWYANDLYSDNEIASYLNEPPGFGPKGKALVIDAHPDPYRSPAWLAQGYANEAANATHRQQMRDAPFSIHDTVPFTLWNESYPGRPGVPVFDDLLGYYPGAEHVLRGPGYDPPVWVWMTKHWDASAVVPARSPYGIAAPGLAAGDPLRYRCKVDVDGLTSCSWFSGGLGYPGGTGNPGDAGGAYGWKVEILSESDSRATLRISNTRPAVCALTCGATAPEFVRVGTAAAFSVAEQLTGCSGGIARSWTFGDGTDGASTASVSHTYSRTGSFRWQVTVAAAGQLCTRSGSITVGNGPDVRVQQGASEIGDGQTAAVSFGSVPQGVRGPALAFTVANRGDIPLQLGPVTVPAGFTLVEPLAAQLAPFGEDTFTVRMESAAQGARGGTIRFATSEPGAEEFDFPVAGAVTAPLSRFDFGTPASPLERGYLRVTAGTRYDAAAGYGWQVGSIGERDRTAGSALRKDLNFTPLGAFAVDLPNGAYVALVTMGDTAGAHDQMAVSLEGSRVDVVSAAAGGVAPRAYRVFVADGQLNLELRDLGGKDANAVINALEIVPVAARRFDFGTAASPLAPGFARVAPTTRHAAPPGYGWSSGAVDARDRATGTPLGCDFNFTALGTFAVDVPNGAYDVAVTLGDASGTHDQMGVFLEGTQVDTVTTAPRELFTRVYRVTVADGRLTVLLDDLGGADPNVVINGLEISAAHDGRFDFGTSGSPVESRYTRVASTARFAAGGGFGWLPATVESRDRGAGTALARDFNFTPLGVFLADLLPGEWDASVIMGDAAAAHDQMALLLEGARVATVTKAANQFHTGLYRVATADDLLAVGLEDLGGADPNAVLNALTLQRVKANAFDFGTAASPVEAGYTRVTSTAAYTPGNGYGWLSGRVEARDRATGTALRRDINATAEATFVVDVPNGAWDVTVTLGDAAAAHDAMGVFLEGARADTVTTAKGQFNSRTYRVVVADGQLTVLLDDLGGADANVTIAALELR